MAVWFWLSFIVLNRSRPGIDIRMRSFAVFEVSSKLSYYWQGLGNSILHKHIQIFNYSFKWVIANIMDKMDNITISTLSGGKFVGSLVIERPARFQKRRREGYLIRRIGRELCFQADALIWPMRCGEVISSIQKHARKTRI